MAYQMWYESAKALPQQQHNVKSWPSFDVRLSLGGHPLSMSTLQGGGINRHTASTSHLRTLLPDGSPQPFPAKWPNHAT